MKNKKGFKLATDFNPPVCQRPHCLGSCKCSTSATYFGYSYKESVITGVAAVKSLRGGQWLVLKRKQPDRRPKAASPRSRHIIPKIKCATLPQFQEGTKGSRNPGDHVELVLHGRGVPSPICVAPGDNGSVLPRLGLNQQHNPNSYGGLCRHCPSKRNIGKCF